MSARRITTSLVAAGALAAAAATAGPATAATYPSISKVSPMEVKIGGTLTLTGKNFLKGKGKNTVVFRRPGKRSIFAKGDGLSTTRIRVVVPDKLNAYLGKRDGAAVASKFQLNVLTRRFGRTYTALKASPTIAPAVTPAPPAPTAPTAPVTTAGATSTATGTPAPAGQPVAQPPVPTVDQPTVPLDTDGDGLMDAIDPDDDNDLLLDTTETAIGTDPRSKDTDGDGLEDGWEYKSATDLKKLSCRTQNDYPDPCDAAMPVPTRGVGYPNPLDGSDADWDFDGDAMTAREEHAGWLWRIARDPSKRTIETLWYSDGLQASIDTSSATGCRGMAVPPPFDGIGNRPQFARHVPVSNPVVSYPDVTDPEYAIYTLDNVGAHAYDGCLDDGERDEDGDFLNNWTEAHGPLSRQAWWRGQYEEEILFERRPFAGTDWLNPNTDNRGPVDGLDDQDDDDFLNVEEAAPRGALSRGGGGGFAGNDRTGLWVHAFNPCLPSPTSRTCPPTLDQGKAAWAPFPQKDGTEPAPRWPLYGSYLYDPFDADPPPADPMIDISLPELWDAPSGYAYGDAPLHPLPR